VRRRERAVGMRVHGKSLGGVEQLHEQTGRRPEPVDVRASEPVLGVGFDEAAQQPPVGEPRQPGLRLVTPGVRRDDGRPDPVLREASVQLLLAAKPADERAAAIEAVHPRGGEPLGAHCTFSPLTPHVSESR
jgi:hypothetical protein